MFDVNETLSDMAALAPRFTEAGLPADLAPLWFATVLREGFALTAAGSTERFADIGAEVLRGLLPAGLDADRAVGHVLAGLLDLPLHPDVPPAVRTLHGADLRLVTLSNGSAQVAEGLLARAGVRDLFEKVLSVEDAGRWKPHPEAYEYLTERCGTPLSAMVMVAVHPWDLDGAARAGMRTAWVDRDDRTYPSYATPPHLAARSMTGLADLLTGVGGGQ